MTDILLSIRRVHCRRILSGEKPAELRKTRPQGECPYHVYLYETKADNGAGAVVGECYVYSISAPLKPTDCALTILGCVTQNQIIAYAREKPIYAWSVCAAKTYSNPRPLSEFGISQPPQSWCYLNKGGLT